MDGPAPVAFVRPPAAPREVRLNAFPGALAEVPRHRFGGGGRRVPGASPTAVFGASKVGQPAYPLSYNGAGEGGLRPPCTRAFDPPALRARTVEVADGGSAPLPPCRCCVMPERRTAVVTARVSATESADWRAKAKAAGVPLSALIRRAMARTRTWTGEGPQGVDRAAEVERERTRQVSRIGNNLNQIAIAGPIATRGRPRPSRSLLSARSPASSPSSGRLRRWPASRARRTTMHIKFLAHGTGSARAAAK